MPSVDTTPTALIEYDGDLVLMSIMDDFAILTDLLNMAGVAVVELCVRSNRRVFGVVAVGDCQRNLIRDGWRFGVARFLGVSCEVVVHVDSLWLVGTGKGNRNHNGKQLHRQDLSDFLCVTFGTAHFPTFPLSHLAHLPTSTTGDTSAVACHQTADVALVALLGWGVP